MPHIPHIDKRLHKYFSPELLEQFYFEYKERKTDYFKPENVSIPMGADGVTHEAFEKELDRNIHFISKKVLNGAYLFYPFRETEVDKPGGGKRTLSIASIRDVLVQQQLYITVYPLIDRLFSHPTVDHVSFAYRKGRSAPQAALYINKYIDEGYVYALDADVVKYFDRIPHLELLDQLGEILGQDTTTYKLIRRFVLVDKVPSSTYKKRRYRRLFGKEIFRKIKPDRKKRKEGVPQGGVLSGMLANFYLHRFDRWLMEEIKSDIDLRYVRYADDFVILVKDQTVLAQLRDMVATRLVVMGLELHTNPEKTRLVDIRDEGLDFVGFHFTANDIEVRRRNIIKFKGRFTDKLRSDLYWNIQPRTVEKRLRAVVNQKLNFKILGRPEEMCPNCGNPIGSRPKSWMGYFSVVTNTNQLRDLDRWMRAEIAQYFLETYDFRVRRKMLRKAELASIEQEYYRLRKRKSCQCPPEIEEIELVDLSADNLASELR